MSEQTQKILSQALLLPPIEQAALVEEILSSFDFPVRQEVDALWAQEVEDRIDADDRGQLESSAKDVFKHFEEKKGE